MQLLNFQNIIVKKMLEMFGSTNFQMNGLGMQGLLVETEVKTCLKWLFILKG